MNNPHNPKNPAEELFQFIVAHHQSSDSMYSYTNQLIVMDKHYAWKDTTLKVTSSGNAALKGIVTACLYRTNLIRKRCRPAATHQFHSTCLENGAYRHPIAERQWEVTQKSDCCRSKRDRTRSLLENTIMVSEDLRHRHHTAVDVESSLVVGILRTLSVLVATLGGAAFAAENIASSYAEKMSEPTRRAAIAFAATADPSGVLGTALSNALIIAKEAPTSASKSQAVEDLNHVANMMRLNPAPNEILKRATNDPAFQRLNILSSLRPFNADRLAFAPERLSIRPEFVDDIEQLRQKGRRQQVLKDFMKENIKLNTADMEKVANSLLGKNQTIDSFVSSHISDAADATAPALRQTLSILVNASYIDANPEFLEKQLLDNKNAYLDIANSMLSKRFLEINSVSRDIAAAHKKLTSSEMRQIMRGDFSADNVNAGMAALAMTTELLGNKTLAADISKAAAVVNGGMQIYKGLSLLAAGAAGGPVVAAMAIIDAAGPLAGFGGASSDKKLQDILNELSDLTELVKEQFEIVNGKLDKISSQLDSVQMQLNEIKSGVARVHSEVMLAREQLGALQGRIDDLESNTIDAIVRIGLSTCITKLQFNMLEKEFQDCWGLFSTAATLRVGAGDYGTVPTSVLGDKILLQGNPYSVGIADFIQPIELEALVEFSCRQTRNEKLCKRRPTSGDERLGRLRYVNSSAGAMLSMIGKYGAQYIPDKFEAYLSTGRTSSIIEILDLDGEIKSLLATSNGDARSTMVAHANAIKSSAIEVGRMIPSLARDSLVNGAFKKNNVAAGRSGITMCDGSEIKYKQVAYFENAPEGDPTPAPFDSFEYMSAALENSLPNWTRIPEIKKFGAVRVCVSSIDAEWHNNQSIFWKYNELTLNVFIGDRLIGTRSVINHNCPLYDNRRTLLPLMWCPIIRGVAEVITNTFSEPNRRSLEEQLIKDLIGSSDDRTQGWLATQTLAYYYPGAVGVEGPSLGALKNEFDEKVRASELHKAHYRLILRTAYPATKNGLPKSSQLLAASKSKMVDEEVFRDSLVCASYHYVNGISSSQMLSDENERTRRSICGFAAYSDGKRKFSFSSALDWYVDGLDDLVQEAVAADWEAESAYSANQLSVNLARLRDFRDRGMLPAYWSVPN